MPSDNHTLKNLREMKFCVERLLYIVYRSFIHDHQINVIQVVNELTHHVIHVIALSTNKRTNYRYYQHRWIWVVNGSMILLHSVSYEQNL